MLKKGILRILNFIIGCALGIAILPFLWEITKLENIEWLNSTFINGLIGGIIFYLLMMLFESRILKIFQAFEQALSKISIADIIIRLIGVIIGLAIGALLSIPLYRINLDVVDNILPACLMLIFAYFGYYLSKNRSEEIKHYIFHKTNHISHEKKANYKPYKILDTNVIIDGRIYDIAKTGFLEGTILIPKFVLYELQYIADSADNLKRVRGRRGLDILNSLQKEENIKVEMYEHDFPDIDEVDTKLIYLAKKVNGAIVTNDYNLNKVSEFQNVQVLNINELANAIKPVVISGETMKVTIVKAGTEREQGVAYMDDGTMIVVENGMHYMNQEIEVYVTSAIQTAAGRMVFARPINEHENNEHD